MIEKFQYYLEENLVKKVKPNKEEAKSLMDSAIKRLEFIKKQEIDDSTAKFIFEDVYETLREASQSLMSIKGYKPYSHEAVISFLIEFYNFSKYEISTFDRYRILRNKAVYSAYKISILTCKDALKFLETFLPKLKARFEKEIK